MKNIINIDEWNRKEHYHFFKSFNEPFYGVVAEVECTSAYNKCINENHSFYLYYLHNVLKSINSVDNLRMRIEKDNVVIFEKINVSPTVGRENTTFGFSFMEYFESFDKFQEEAKKEIERVKSLSGLCLTETTERIDTIHFSALPWVKFTSVSHARMIGSIDSAPKISVGKMTGEAGKYTIPVSIHVHHALVDGYHISQFFKKLESLLK